MSRGKTKKKKNSWNNPPQRNITPQGKKKVAPPPKTVRRYQNMNAVRHAAPLSNYGAAVQALVRAIYEGNAGASGTFFNHGYDRDPATNGGAVPGDTTVFIYYFPATEQEIRDHETIAGAGVLSGRRRLAARRQNGGYPDYEEIWSFYATNHPREAPGLRTNVYGTFTPIDPSR